MTELLVPVDRLVLDYAIYPRHALDEDHVRRLADALRAGALLPPPIVEAGTYRVVDGFHRTRAHVAVHGPTAPIRIEIHAYASEADLIADAVRRNVAHGLRLQRWDQVRATRLLVEAGHTVADIARLMALPEARVIQLQCRIARTPSGEPVELKGSLLHMRGQTLTEHQVAVVREAPGVRYRLLARQLARALAVGLVPHDDATREALRELAQLLGRYLHEAA